MAKKTNTKSETMPQVYKCEICEKVLKTKKILTRHSKNHHDDQKIKSLQCNICTKKYLTVKNLTNHTRTVHALKKVYKCESCGKSFTHAHSLKKHIYTIHEGNKDYKCESCGKSFSEGGKLKNTYTQFMKATKITNVNLVVNHFLTMDN